MNAFTDVHIEAKGETGYQDGIYNTFTQYPPS